ncbi:MAG: hypothetical protein AB7Q29_04635 [Vicinamibacterales bacterium]
MLNSITRNRLVGFWFGAVALIIGSVLATGVNVAVSTTAFLLALSLVPPGIVMALWSGGSSPTVGEILYATNARTDSRS